MHFGDLFLVVFKIIPQFLQFCFFLVFLKDSIQFWALIHLLLLFLRLKFFWGYARYVFAFLKCFFIDLLRMLLFDAQHCCVISIINFALLAVQMVVTCFDESETAICHHLFVLINQFRFFLVRIFIEYVFHLFLCHFVNNWLHQLWVLENPVAICSLLKYYDCIIYCSSFSFVASFVFVFTDHYLLDFSNLPEVFLNKFFFNWS